MGIQILYCEKGLPLPRASVSHCRNRLNLFPPGADNSEEKREGDYLFYLRDPLAKPRGYLQSTLKRKPSKTPLQDRMEKGSTSMRLESE